MMMPDMFIHRITFQKAKNVGPFADGGRETHAISFRHVVNRL